MRAIFIGEGSSDRPLAEIVASLFEREGVQIDVVAPDLDLLPGLRRDVGSKVAAALSLTGARVDLLVIHRDSDNAGSPARRNEIHEAIEANASGHRHLCVIPVHMTEAWLILDETAIRQVSGNPGGRLSLGLPAAKEAERRADPKAILAEAILIASAESGRRRERVVRRFNENRRRLLEQLDIDGPVNQLESWQELVADVRKLAATFAES